MKAKALFFLVGGGLLVLAAWLVHVPSPAQADEVPEKYRETLHKGLEYLARNQHKDGRWEGDGGKHPVAMTGLAGLALLMETNKLGDRTYANNIRKAVDWLIARSKAGRHGLIISEHPSETSCYMEGHGLATLFLAGVLSTHDESVHTRPPIFDGPDDRLKELREVLARAVDWIVKAQTSQGGWYHTSRTEGHDLDEISATAIQVQALAAAYQARMDVPMEVINDAQEYLKFSLGKREETPRRPAQTAAGLACRINTIPLAAYGAAEDDGWCKLWFKYCQAGIPVGRASQFGRDDLSHYYYAQAAFILGRRGKDRTWNDYRTAMFDHLQSNQNKDGSWPAPSASQGGPGVGPVYATALWCTVLQLDRDRHPATPHPFEFRQR